MLRLQPEMHPSGIQLRSSQSFSSRTASSTSMTVGQSWVIGREIPFTTHHVDGRRDVKFPVTEGSP